MDRLVAANELAFRIGFSGCSGHLRLEPLSPVERPNPLTSIPDFIIPGAFEPETPETLKKRLEDEYLRPELDADEFSVQNSGRQWDFDWFDKSEVPLEPSLPRSVVVPSWELPFRRAKNRPGHENWIPDSVEVEVAKLLDGSQEPGSSRRMHGQTKDFVRGSFSNRPFHPGGLDTSQPSDRFLLEGACNGDWVREVLEGGSPQTLPPGFKRGLNFGCLKKYPNSWTCIKKHVASGLDEHQVSSYLQFEDLFKKAMEEILDEGSVRDGDLAESLHMNDDAGKEEIESSTLEIDGAEERRQTVLASVDESSALVDLLLNDIYPTIKADEVSEDDGQHVREEKESAGIQGIANRFHELVPEMALEFPFELDAFQKEAIYYLERGDSVFVAAHTSAGKTVIAEYAFALATKHCTRAVYTAPIKTISNQKYRDFCEKFDVGLLTGDVTLRPEASCLIMTTEILRSMLYKGADIIRDIEWVIFDEVHYVNDAERGVVWEEVIIMLPSHINIVLLSATVPNTNEFADWIARTKQKKICVTGTDKRPVPLKHCLFFSGEFFTVCENECFLPQGIRSAKVAYHRKFSSTFGAASGSSLTLMQTPGGSQSYRRGSVGRGKGLKHSVFQNTGSLLRTDYCPQNQRLKRSDASLWLLLINKLSKKSLLPVVIFCFSKNRCDKSADSLCGTDLTSSSEKSKIRIFCDKAFSRLKGSDRNLPQVIRIQTLLHRGVGVHHAGLLPIVKEVVEMLFCRGMVKILFSTETFAMGVNAPARTVVFDKLRKFDGKEFRQLLPGEYTQMAGRAGRRGLDKIGMVIIMCRDEIMEESELQHVIIGRPTVLESQFRLTYTMILHLLRIEELKVEDMLKRSFAEFHAQKMIPEKQQLLMLKLAQPVKAVECIKGEPAIEEYFNMAVDSEEHINYLSEKVMQSHAAQQFLSPGRVVVVKSQAEDHLMGVVLRSPSANFKQYVVLVLWHDLPAPAVGPSVLYGKSLEKENDNLPRGYFIAPKGKRGPEEDYYAVTIPRKGSGAINIELPYYGTAAGMNYKVMAIESKEFLSICNSKIMIDQIGLLEEPCSSAYSKTVQQLINQKPKGNKYPPALDPIRDFKLKDMDLVDKYRTLNNVLQKMAQSKCHGCIKLKENKMLLKEHTKHKEEVNALKFQMSDEALQQMPDFQGRIDVLKEIGCIDSDLVVQIKGRVACEMNSGDELICAECLFENQLDELEPAEAVAIMSAFVFQQQSTSEPSLTPKLSLAKQRLHDTAVRLAKLQVRFKVAIDPEEYVQENLKFGLTEVVYEWAKGTPFSDICELTDMPEGLIVRTIVWLDETCREFRNAAAIMGNSELHKKMETASNAIKRDIVFAASLYITGV